MWANPSEEETFAIYLPSPPPLTFVAANNKLLYVYTRVSQVRIWSSALTDGSQRVLSPFHLFIPYIFLLTFPFFFHLSIYPYIPRVLLSILDPPQDLKKYSQNFTINNFNRFLGKIVLFETVYLFFYLSFFFFTPKNQTAVLPDFIERYFVTVPRGTRNSEVHEYTNLKSIRWEFLLKISTPLEIRKFDRFRRNRCGRQIRWKLFKRWQREKEGTDSKRGE